MDPVLTPGVPDDCGLDTFIWLIYREKRFTDVEFILETPAGSISFLAHKMVLSMWSSVFEDMFYKGEMQSVKILKDVNQQAFEDTLEFMYGVDPVLNSHKTACDLLKVAAEFGVTALITLCQNYLLKVDIEVRNVFDILEIAEQMQNRDLINKCRKLVETETKSIIACYDCSDFSPEMVQILLKSPKLSLDSEFELINWMFAWAKNRVVDDTMYSNIREALTEFLPLLNFLALTNVQFTTICRHHNDFFSDNEALSIFMNIGIRDSRDMPDWYDKNAKSREYTGKRDGFV